MALDVARPKIELPLLLMMILLLQMMISCRECRLCLAVGAIVVALNSSSDNQYMLEVVIV